MDENEVYVSAREAAQMGYCVSGAKAVFAKSGANFKKYVKGELTVAELREINDPLAQQLADRIMNGKGGS